jgi:hypothetical protein
MPASPIGASASGSGVVSPMMLVERSRRDTSTSTRWRSLIRSRSARFARKVSWA